jgi:prepilin-type N-terminal cleavage/methylation domain-containing protein
MRARERVPRAGDDAGFSIIELLVAIVLIVIVVFSGFMAIDYGLSQTGAQRFRVEAVNLATATLEFDENTINAAEFGTTTSVRNINGTLFSISTTVSELAQNGGQLVSVCTNGSTSVTQQIWQVTVAITWPHMNGAQPITQQTEVSPQAANAGDLVNGELAVAVDGADGSPLKTPVNFTVTPEYVGTPPAPPYPTPTGQKNPSGTVFNTGTAGCGVVTGLSPSPVWHYLVTMTPNPGWVASTEQSDSDPNVNQYGTGGAAYWIGAAPAAAVTTTTPIFVLSNAGTQTAINFQPTSYACPSGPPDSCAISSGPSYATPANDLPVTFANPSLSQGQYTFGNASQKLSSVLVFPYANYSVWAGDMSQSSPGYQKTGGGYFYSGPGSATDAPLPVNYAPTPPAATINVPTYYLGVQLVNAGACPNATLVAIEQSGASYTYTLNPAVSNISASGMPLGQYEVTATGCGSVTPVYVWLTPSGVYSNSSPMSDPYSNTAVAQNVSLSL